ncbi:MAG TPA: hypothetical protein VGQ71_08110, partial [Terriglobales bacterium]|nr:hypothetical protein [Terriglobales bacterium]
MRARLESSRNYTRQAQELSLIQPTFFSAASFATEGAIREKLEQIDAVFDVESQYNEMQRHAFEAFKAKMSQIDARYWAGLEPKLRPGEIAREQMIVSLAEYRRATTDLYSFALR